MSKVDDILAQGSAFPKNETASDPFSDQNFFDNLQVDEDAIEAKRNGGGEAFEPSSSCEGGGCVI